MTRARRTIAAQQSEIRALTESNHKLAKALNAAGHPNALDVTFHYVGGTDGSTRTYDVNFAQIAHNLAENDAAITEQARGVIRHETLELVLEALQIDGYRSYAGRDTARFLDDLTAARDSLREEKAASDRRLQVSNLRSTVRNARALRDRGPFAAAGGLTGRRASDRTFGFDLADLHGYVVPGLDATTDTAAKITFVKEGALKDPAAPTVDELNKAAAEGATIQATQSDYTLVPSPEAAELIDSARQAAAGNIEYGKKPRKGGARSLRDISAENIERGRE